MKIGICASSYGKYPLEERYKIMRAHGYESTDFGMSDTESAPYTLTDAEVAQIEDIVKRKTGMEASQIRINTLSKCETVYKGAKPLFLCMNFCIIHCKKADYLI